MSCYEDVLSCDLDKYASYYRFLRDNGIYIAPSQFEALFLSLAHTDDEINAFCAAAAEVFAEIA